MFDSPENK